ncbi:hypothetical protein ABIA33_003757 [Streptacidiphilus sp. MAP12-16]|jgi:hypothetical protein|uniref:Imm21 family immunity protein n=1 Tax=Streptacidiphilus sp. MAP12-16 TaxID=3156300 RepID=UPI0035139E35
MGGPLIAVPNSALTEWSGCTEVGMVMGDVDTPDDYDRACEAVALAAVIGVGQEGALALVLADQSAGIRPLVGS